MTKDEEMIENAAKEFSHSNTFVDSRFTSTSAFKAGVAWRDANPSQEVLGMIVTLKGYHEGCKYLAVEYCNKCGRFPADEFFRRWEASQKPVIDGKGIK